jgi:hypothetical protein
VFLVAEAVDVEPIDHVELELVLMIVGQEQPMMWHLLARKTAKQYYTFITDKIVIN